MATINGDSGENILNGGPEGDLIQGSGGHDELSSPDPNRPLERQERLVLAGTPENLRRLRTSAAG